MQIETEEGRAATPHPSPQLCCTEYEWIEDGKGYREWLIPATVVNEHGRISVKNAM
jgi:hypothetical protein